MTDPYYTKMIELNGTGEDGGDCDASAKFKGKEQAILAKANKVAIDRPVNGLWVSEDQLEPLEGTEQ